MAVAGLISRSFLRPFVGRSFSALSQACSVAVPTSHGCSSTNLSRRHAYLDRLPKDNEIFQLRGFKPETSVLVVDIDRLPSGSMSIEEAILTQPKYYNLVLVRRYRGQSRLPVVRRFAPDNWEAWRSARRAWQSVAAVRKRELRKAIATKERNRRKEINLKSKGKKVFETSKRAAKKRK